MMFHFKFTQQQKNFKTLYFNIVVYWTKFVLLLLHYFLFHLRLIQREVEEWQKGFTFDIFL